MVTRDSKLYIQFQPDDTGLGLVRSVQQSLEPMAALRLVDRASMHLTVLHIGAVGRMIRALKGYTAMPPDEILAHTERLIGQLEQVLKPVTESIGKGGITLLPVAYDRFGARRSTYVMTFQTMPALDSLHQQSLDVLKSFFGSCGVNDVMAFMQNDENFKHALSLRPHITIAKCYTGKEADVPLQPITLRAMPITY